MPGSPFKYEINHGSLAFSAKGHGTDRAVILGPAGENPQTMDPDRVEDVAHTQAAADQSDYSLRP